MRGRKRKKGCHASWRGGNDWKGGRRGGGKEGMLCIMSGGGGMPSITSERERPAVAWGWSLNNLLDTSFGNLVIG